MDFKERKIDFREADSRHEELVRRHEAGEINDREFDDGRKKLSVRDEEGRWWAKSAKTGEWKFHDGNEWSPGIPPGYAAEEDAAKSEPEGGRAGESGRVEGAAREVVDGGEARRPSLRRPIAVAALLLAILLVGAGYALTRSMTLTSGSGRMGGSGGSVAVPDLSGASSIEEAKNAAGETFEVVEAERVESEEPIGAVVSQNPASGEQADEDSTIFVETSVGVGVPDVEGNERGDAVRTLEEAGFEVEVETDESSGGNEGRIIAQKPRAGESAEAGSSVEITVGDETGDDGSDTAASDTAASGVSDSGGGGGGGFAGGSGSENESPTEPPTDYRVPVPDVIGERVEDAEEILEDAGFSTDVEDIESGEPKGTVVWTDPDPGVLLDPSSGEVVIGVSSGPPGTPPGTSPETSPESPPDEQYAPPDEGS